MALKLSASAGAALVAAFFLGVLVSLSSHQFLGPVRVAENGVRDLLHMIAYPRAEQSSDVVIVAITEETLATLTYRSPIDRAFMANLLETLAAHGPASIGVDVIFDSPTEALKDEKLASALATARPFPLVAAYPDQDVELAEFQRAYLDAIMPEEQRSLAILLADPDDNVMREIKGKEGDIPSFAFAMSRAPAPAGPVPIAYQFMSDPTEARFPVYPAHVAAALPAAWFTGKHILIGAILPQTDSYPTPRASLVGGADTEPGVMIHAQALQQILDGRSLRTANQVERAGLVIVAAIVALLIMLAPVPVVFRALGIMALCLAWALSAAAVLRYASIVMPVITPVFAIVLASIIKGGAEWRSERREKAYIRSTFSRYVAPEVVREIIETPEILHRRPVLREATCVFTDVAGFTSMTERHKSRPEAFEVVLNEYLSGMASIFHRHEATLDKFIGDAVVGFFGGPLERADHAQLALAMVAELDAFAERFAGNSDILDGGFGHTRIGVHSGKVLIGNFGGEDFFDYTAIGDAVNTAARLESANKHFGTRVCVSDATLSKADVRPLSRPIGRIILKGKSEPLLVHEIVTQQDAEASTKSYTEAYNLLDTDAAAALKAFKGMTETQPGDGLAAFHLERLSRGERGSLVEMETK